MSKKKRIFISCVSSEFHKTRADDPFVSYRAELAGDLEDHGFEVMTQERLLDGGGDLLELIEQEIKRCQAVIHLVGDMTGDFPKEPAVRRLLERHPKFLPRHPELRAALGDLPQLSYTQWEAILGLHFHLKCLIYRARPEAPRSPEHAPTSESLESQDAHWDRLDEDGKARGRFVSQDKLCRRVAASVRHALDDGERGRWRDQASEWRAQLSDLMVRGIAFRPAAMPNAEIERDAAIERIAAQAELPSEEILGILEAHRAAQEEEAEAAPSHETLWELALAWAAEGRFERAGKVAERAAYEAEEAVDLEAAQDAFQFAAHAYTKAYLHDAAIASFKRACQFVDMEKTPLDWAAMHQALARYLLDRGHFEESEPWIRQCVSLREEHQGMEHKDLASCLLLLASWLFHTGNYRGAEVVAERVLGFFEHDADQTPYMGSMLAALTLLGLSLKSQGAYEDAKDPLEGALAISESWLGAEHPDTLTSVNNLANLLDSTGRYEEAEPLYQRALETRERTLGPEHPSTLRSVNNLAGLLKETGRYEEAEPLYRRALEARERTLGPEHPHTLTSVNNLANLLKSTGRYEEAEPLYRRDLEASERTLGPEHPDTLISVNNLALLLKSTGRYEEAEPLCRRAVRGVASLSKRLEREHPHQLGYIANYKRCLEAMGCEAAEQERRVAELLE